MVQLFRIQEIIGLRWLNRNKTVRAVKIILFSNFYLKHFCCEVNSTVYFI